MCWLTNSSLLFCLQLLLLHSQSYAKLCPPTESDALLQFKQHFSFKKIHSKFCDDGRGALSYPKMLSWNDNHDCCSWDGITCHLITGHVVGLDLSCSWLHGEINSNSSLFLLSHLQSLNLAFNDFNLSRVTSGFSRFPGLTLLNLASSSFDGQVPPEISHLSKLVSLDLSNNFLSLKQPVWKALVQNLTDLKELILSSVGMSRIVPGSFMNISSSLTSLALAGCSLRGNFPNNIFHALPNLQKLILSENYKLTGKFPTVNTTTPLSLLDVFATSFTGIIPDSIGNIKSLRHLDLAACKFMGSIPASIGNLTKLIVLEFSYNNFSGYIPSSFSNLEKLRHLHLSENNFVGEIPDIFSNLTQLSSLDFSWNQLAGPIPSDVIRLQNLVSIFFNANSLNGTIPSELSSLPLLEEVDLSHNHLTGHIVDFQYHFALKSIDLSHNRLDGSIPGSIFELSNLKSLKLSSNNLGGIVEFYLFSKLKNLEELDLSHNYLSVSSKIKLNSSSFPKVHSLQLSSCNINEFPEVLRTLNNLEVLDLSNNRIHGQIPKWMGNVGQETLSLLNLSNNFLTGTNTSWESLEFLDLSNNKIHGQIPPLLGDIGQSTLLFLSLANNSLTGINQISWKHLLFLDLRLNLLRGSLPVLPQFLRYVFVSNNKLTGEIRHWVCKLDTIEILDLSNNYLSGSIPECMGKFSDSLRVLDLRNNRFFGTIPGSFAKGNSLMTLDLHNNELEGPVPRSLLNCTQLKFLDLGNNNINDTFPYWLEVLPNLQVLVLRSNKFYGGLNGYHEAKHPFHKLRIFDLSNNSFGGSLPTRYLRNLKAIMKVGEGEGELQNVEKIYLDDPAVLIINGFYYEISQYMGDIYYKNSVVLTIKGYEIALGRILKIFTIIDFSNNNFHGEIPKSFGKLHSLALLNLSHNSLTRHIPSSIGKLLALESLDLSSNKLAGKIPQQLGDLTFLAFLNLSQNQLTGKIPRGTQLDTFGSDSYCGNSGLCGFPLPDCSIGQPSEPSPKSGDTESEIEFGWRIVMMGYGAGLVLGMSMGYIVFSTRKPQWLVRIVEGEQQRVRRLIHKRKGRRM